MTKKNTAIARRSNTAAKTAELVVIQIGNRTVPVSAAIQATLDTGRQCKDALAGAWEEFGRKIVDVARKMVPAYNDFCGLVDVPTNRGRDLWLTQIDPQYVIAESRTPGTYSMSAHNRWRNMMAAYAADQARTQLETIAALPDGGRDTAIAALPDPVRKQIAKLDLSDSSDLAEIRGEVLGTGEGTENKAKPMSATDVRNGLIATVLALAPIAQRTALLDAMIGRMRLSEGAAKSLRETGSVVSPWVTCKTRAGGVAYVAPVADETEETEEEENKPRGRRRTAA